MDATSKGHGLEADTFVRLVDRSIFPMFLSDQCENTAKMLLIESTRAD